MSNSNNSKKLIKAIAVINARTPSECAGTIQFSEVKNSNLIEIDINLKNLKPGKHGFHIHESGNLNGGCGSCCAHFNPTNTIHGGKDSKTRHIGDLGNIKANKNGSCKTKTTDSKIKLRGTKFNIIGRSVVIHADEDDLGEGDNQESLVTGNAGARIGCAVIGYKEAHYF